MQLLFCIPNRIQAPGGISVEDPRSVRQQHRDIQDGCQSDGLHRPGWLKEAFLDWAFTFTSTYLYYEDRDTADENTLNLYRKSLACFEGNAPTYHLSLQEHPVIVWDFHSLMLAIKFLFSVKLTAEKNPMSLCEHCRMVFYAPRADSRFCSAECRNKASRKPY